MASGGGAKEKKRKSQRNAPKQKKVWKQQGLETREKKWGGGDKGSGLNGEGKTRRERKDKPEKKKKQSQELNKWKPSKLKVSGTSL